MPILEVLAVTALRYVIRGACEYVGVPTGLARLAENQAGSVAKRLKEQADSVVNRLKEHNTDHSRRLTNALRGSTVQAWRALEVALAGDSLWDRCKVTVARGEDKAFAEQVRLFLEYSSHGGLATIKPDLRAKALRELRDARKAGHLAGSLDPNAVAQQAGDFARFADPAGVLNAEWHAVAQVAGELRPRYPHLSQFLSLRPPQGFPLLTAAVRYFFRRAVETDAELFRGLAITKLERLEEGQEKAFGALEALNRQGQRMEAMLQDVQDMVVETHGAVSDLKDRLQGMPEQVQQIGRHVLEILEQYQLQRRDLRPSDGLSIRNDTERQLVKQLVGRYRALPDRDRQQVPALLNAIGKLEVVAGDFDAARKDFQTVAQIEKDVTAQAEAHFNAFQAAMEQREHAVALLEFFQAVKLDARRFATFPVGKYHPLKILGAGGFGVAFLCKHKYMDAQVVVKTLSLEALGRDADSVFTEAQVLRELDHPAIVRVSDCGYVDPGKSRPFLVMDYFDGMTLEEHVKKNGSLSAADLSAIARQVADGLRAAHGKKILHRDVKPANLLVRKDASGWRVKIIDFGLAMRQKVAKKSMNASTARTRKTLIGGSIAGTLDYAAPEQMGRLEGVEVTPASDVYGFAKTSCYALFQTPQPTLRHWQSLPAPLAELLGRCLEEDPKKRPGSFSEVLQVLAGAREQAIQPFQFQEAEGRPPAPARRVALRSKPRRPLWPWLVAGGVGLLAVVLVLGMTVFRVQTKIGTVVVEINQPGADLSVDGNQLTITSAGDKESVKIDVDEGMHQLRVTKGGFEAVTKQFSLKAGATEIIRVRLEPVKVAKKDRPPFAAGNNVPKPIALWTFENDARDSIGNMHGKLVGDAVVANGRLRLTGDKAAMDATPLPVDIREKTLEMWVVLPDLRKPSVVMYIANDRTAAWDGIVFGAIKTSEWLGRPMQWCLRSSYNERNGDLEGPLESAKANERVHVAVSYASDNSITMYRNGKAYGAPVVPQGPKNAQLQTYSKETSRVVFGSVWPHVLPSVEIEEARLYDRALTAQEIAASFAKGYAKRPLQPKTEPNKTESKAEVENRIPDPAKFRYLEHSWSKGKPPVTMLSNKIGFAFLSGVGGKFGGGGEWLRVFPDTDGNWRLEGKSAQPVGGYAICVETPERQFFQSEIKEYEWGGKGTPPIKMLAERDGICFLSYVVGEFLGSGEQVGVFVKDGYWYLDGRSVKPIGGRAIALRAEKPGSLRAKLQEYVWKPNDKPIRMIPGKSGVCFLSSVEGHFGGGGEAVRVHLEADGYWYLSGHSAQDSVRAKAISVMFSNAVQELPPAKAERPVPPK